MPKKIPAAIEEVRRQRREDDARLAAADLAIPVGHLMLRSDTDRANADKYAAELVASGTIRADQAEEMAQGLQETAEFYRTGKGIQAARKRRNPKEIKPILMNFGRGRPTCYGIRGLVWVMAIIWEHFGNHAGTAEGTFNDSPFQRFVTGWLALIDPSEKEPSRKAFRSAIEKLRKQGSN